jgi:hypothetical protein
MCITFEDFLLIHTHCHNINQMIQKIKFNIHTLNKEMVDKIHSQNNIFLIGITHRFTCEQY